MDRDFVLLASGCSLDESPGEAALAGQEAHAATLTLALEARFLADGTTSIDDPTVQCAATGC